MQLTRQHTVRGLAATFVAGALVILGCGGGEEDSLTPEQAAAVVSAGLLTEADLPNLSWDVEEIDNLTNPDAEDDDDFFATTESCQALAAVFGDSDSPPSLSDAERAFESGGESLVVRSVRSNVFVPHADVDVGEAFDALADFFTADSLRACFEDGMRSSLEGEDGITISGIDIREPEHLVPDGVGVTMDLSAIALIIPIDVHIQMHMWPEGPAVGSLMLMEMNSTLLQQNAGDIVDNAHSRLAAAVEAN